MSVLFPESLFHDARFSEERGREHSRFRALREEMKSFCLFFSSSVLIVTVVVVVVVVVEAVFVQQVVELFPRFKNNGVLVPVRVIREWTRCGCGLLIVRHHRATTSTKKVMMCLNLNDDFVRVSFFDFSLEVLKFETYSSFLGVLFNIYRLIYHRL